MQIIGVAGVNDSHVATGESMLMGVLSMPGAYAHRHPRGCEVILSIGANSELRPFDRRLAL
jgi:hypothetical protein